MSSHLNTDFYLHWLLFGAALWASTHVLVAVLSMWDSANVSETVTSQAMGLPFAHGRRVSHWAVCCHHTSDWLPLWLLVSGLASVLSRWCYSNGCVFVVLGHLCSKVSHVVLVHPPVSHIHVWGSQAFHPSLLATATLIALFDSLSPTAVIGEA